MNGVLGMFLGPVIPFSGGGPGCLVILNLWDSHFLLAEKLEFFPCQVTKKHGFFGGGHLWMDLHPSETAGMGHFERKGLSSNHYFAGDTVDGRNPIQPPGIFKIRDKEWDKLPTTTGDRRISEPSTAC